MLFDTEQDMMIKNFKEEGIIDEQGYVDYLKIFKAAGMEEVGVLLDRLDHRCVLLSTSLENLRKRAIDDADLIQTDLKNGFVPFDETMDLLEILTVLKEKERCSVLKKPKKKEK
jgi:hypothetical protein